MAQPLAIADMTDINPDRVAPLTTPLRLGALRLPNRIVRTPWLRCCASLGQVATLAMMEHYAAQADAGLIISEAIQVSPNGRQHANAPGLYSAEQVVAWQGVIDAVHQAGGRVAARLRLAPDAADQDAVAQACRLARRAGFDAVEIDAMPDAALGRAALAGDVTPVMAALEAAMEWMGPGRTGIRLGLTGACSAALEDGAGQIAGLIARIDGERPAFLHLEAPLANRDLCATARALFRGPLVLNAGLGERAGRRLVAEGLADAATLLATPPISQTAPVSLPALAAE